MPSDHREEPTRVPDLQAEEQRDLSPDGKVAAFNDTQARPGGRILVLDLASGVAHPLLDPAIGDRDPPGPPTADGSPSPAAAEDRGPRLVVPQPESPEGGHAHARGHGRRP
ncbi:MAG: hypothetical protein U0800_24300 [Isosphaeraceae bacterium]